MPRNWLKAGTNLACQAKIADLQRNVIGTLKIVLFTLKVYCRVIFLIWCQFLCSISVSTFFFEERVNKLTTSSNFYIIWNSVMLKNGTMSNYCGQGQFWDQSNDLNSDDPRDWHDVRFLNDGKVTKCTFSSLLPKWQEDTIPAIPGVFLTDQLNEIRPVLTDSMWSN